MVAFRRGASPSPNVSTARPLRAFRCDIAVKKRASPTPPGSECGSSEGVSGYPESVSEPEGQKERTDRQLIELLTELRVVLPGAQVLLAFLFSVPFAARFGEISRPQRAGFFISLLFTATGTVLLMAPSIYHRLRWRRGGKADVVRVGHSLFLVGTAFLAVGLLAGLLLVSDVLYGTLAAVIATTAVATCLVVTWYALALTRGRSAESEQEE